MFVEGIKIKLKDVTLQRQDIVTGLKIHSPEFSEVKVYERGLARFIHSFNDDMQMLSISMSQGKVTEKDWIYAIKKIMKLKITDAMISVRPSGVVIIREKPDTLPSVAY